MTRTVAINSFRRGVGRSTIAANLAVLLTLEGQRVGLVDANLQAPGLHVLFRQYTTQITYSLNDYLQNKCNAQQTAYRVTPTAAPDHHGQLFLIPANPNLGEIARMVRQGYDLDRFLAGLQELAGSLELDLLLIDTQHGLNEETLFAIALSDLLLLLLRTDQQDYRGTAITVELARKLNVNRVLLLVNEAPTTLDFAAIKTQIAQTYGYDVIAVLAHFEEVMALASAEIFVLRYPNHFLTTQLKQIGSELVKL